MILKTGKPDDNYSRVLTEDEELGDIYNRVLTEDKELDEIYSRVEKFSNEFVVKSWQLINKNFHLVSHLLFLS